MGWRAVFGALVAIIVATQVARAQQPVPQPRILIFGGLNHKEFLGCLNCSEMDSDSVWNDFSQYGWRNGFATWNPFGPYKNPFGGESACNEFATDSPVLVDKGGRYYGRLSVNEMLPDGICGAQGSPQVCRALKVMCSDQ